MKVNLGLMIAGKYFDGDDKPNFAAGIVMLLAMLSFVYFFDKLVIKRERGHARFQLKKKGFKHSFLQMIEFFVGLYFFRSGRSFDEPFRKATKIEKRAGGCFMALWPLFLMLTMNYTKSFDVFVDSMMYGRRWIGWFYLIFIALIGSVVFFAIKIAPKIPLSVSVPIAVISWPLLAWFIWTHDLI